MCVCSVCVCVGRMMNGTVSQKTQHGQTKLSHSFPRAENVRVCDDKYDELNEPLNSFGCGCVFSIYVSNSIVMRVAVRVRM